MRSAKTKKIDTAARRPLHRQRGNDAASIERLMQAMTAFMGAGAADAAAPAQRAA